MASCTATPSDEARLGRLRDVPDGFAPLLARFGLRFAMEATLFVFMPPYQIRNYPERLSDIAENNLTDGGRIYKARMECGNADVGITIVRYYPKLRHRAWLVRLRVFQHSSVNVNIYAAPAHVADTSA